jgi:hypothetical protein
MQRRVSVPTSSLWELRADQVILVIYFLLPASEDGSRLEKAVAGAFDKLNPPSEFLGYFCGLKHGDSERFVVATKWSSKQFIDDAGWTKNSEETLLAALGGKAQIERRLQMYA